MVHEPDIAAIMHFCFSCRNIFSFVLFYKNKVGNICCGDIAKAFAPDSANRKRNIYPMARTRELNSRDVQQHIVFPIPNIMYNILYL